MKYHMIHSHWRFSLPARHLRRLAEERKIAWLFWEDTFTFDERTIHGLDNIAAELERYVATLRPYPRVLLVPDHVVRLVLRLVRGALRRALRIAWPSLNR